MMSATERVGGEKHWSEQGSAMRDVIFDQASNFRFRNSIKFTSELFDETVDLRSEYFLSD